MTYSTYNSCNLTFFLPADINRIKSERKKVEQEINTLRAAQQYSRVRKNDVDEAKENAERMARERDEIANDPRLNDIPLKIKEHEKKIETLKRSIEDETEVLGNLRKNAQEQTSIATLEKEIDLDVERLEDVLKDNSFILNKYNLKATTELSSLEALAEAASDKKAKLAEELRICSERVAGKQQKYTEQKTLWEHARRSIKDLQRRLQTLESDSRSGYNEVNKTIESIRVYEAQTSGSSTTPTSIDPKELAANLNRHLQDMNADGDDETAVVQTIRKLKKMVRQLFCPLVNYVQSKNHCWYLCFDRALLKIIQEAWWMSFAHVVAVSWTQKLQRRSTNKWSPWQIPRPAQSSKVIGQKAKRKSSSKRGTTHSTVA